MTVEEREIELDAPVGVVPGTLVLPGAAAGAVLLSGGGPFDRDETSGPNKPLRDLAVGLAVREAGTERVFVVGHGMGGKVAPRVATAEPGLAGLVIMAGDASPMHRVAVRVARHLAALYPGEKTAEMVETFERQAAELEARELPPAEPMMLGFSGAYWADLRAYDLVATAAELDRRC